MTTTQRGLQDVLRPVKHVLLDFDGPVCSVFAGLPAPEVAARLSASLAAPGQQIAGVGDAGHDPLALLRRIGDERPDLVPAADRILAELEEEAVRLAGPTPGGESVLHACAATGRSVWMVSNNASSAIQAYLDAHGLNGCVAGVFGRVPGDPSSMKPSPRLLHNAMEAASATPTECIFIGDAARDVQAGHAAGVATIGYANKPGKESALAAAGAAAVVDSMEQVAVALS